MLAIAKFGGSSLSCAAAWRQVREIVTGDIARRVGARALLGALNMQEALAQTVNLRTGEENFHHLLSDPQDIS